MKLLRQLPIFARIIVELTIETHYSKLTTEYHGYARNQLKAILSGICGSFNS